MKSRGEQIRSYFITSLAMSMITIFWIFCIDALFFGTGRFLFVISMVTIFNFLWCLSAIFIKNYLEKYFVLSVLLEFGMIILLFYVFGKALGWYPEGKDYLFFVYGIPVYFVGYGLRLVGIHKDAEAINKYLKARKRRM